MRITHAHSMDSVKASLEVFRRKGTVAEFLQDRREDKAKELANEAGLSHRRRYKD